MGCEKCSCAVNVADKESLSKQKDDFVQWLNDENLKLHCEGEVIYLESKTKTHKYLHNRVKIE